MQVIDSSALVKFFSREEGWEELSSYVEESLTMRFALSELGNSLLKKVRSDRIDREKTKAVLAAYSRKAVLMHDEEYVSIAFQISLENGLAMYDSMFIAACKDESLSLVTCDDEQARVARKLGISVIEC